MAENVTHLPGFTLDALDGKARTFPTGGPALLCFVKEDCPTCGLTMPLIEAACRAADGAVDVIAIGQDRAGNEALVKRYQLTVPMLDDSALKVSFEYAIEIVPTIILADANGAELRRFVGFGKWDWQELLAELTRIARVCRAADRLAGLSGLAPRMRLEVGRAGYRGAPAGGGGRQSAQGAADRDCGPGRRFRVHVRSGADRRLAGDSADAGAGHPDARRNAA